MTNYNDHDEHTWIATVVGAHGIKGAIRARYVTDTPDYYLKEKVFFLEKEGILVKKNRIENFEEVFWDPIKELEL